MSDITLQNVDEVEKTAKICRALIYRKVADGSFPAPVKIGRASRWRSDDIQAWIESLPRSTEKETFNIK